MIGTFGFLFKVELWLVTIENKEYNLIRSVLSLCHFCSAQADEMTVPADVNSVSGLINSMIKCFRALPHIRDLKEPFQAISDLQIWLLEQRDKPLTAQDDIGLQSLQDVLLKDLR